MLVETMAKPGKTRGAKSTARTAAKKAGTARSAPTAATRSSAGKKATPTKNEGAAARKAVRKSRSTTGKNSAVSGAAKAANGASTGKPRGVAQAGPSQPKPRRSAATRRSKKTDSTSLPVLDTRGPKPTSPSTAVPPTVHVVMRGVFHVAQSLTTPGGRELTTNCARLAEAVASELRRDPRAMADANTLTSLLATTIDVLAPWQDGDLRAAIAEEVDRGGSASKEALAHLQAEARSLRDRYRGENWLERAALGVPSGTLSWGAAVHAYRQGWPILPALFARAPWATQTLLNAAIRDLARDEVVARRAEYAIGCVWLAFRGAESSRYPTGASAAPAVMVTPATAKAPVADAVDPGDEIRALGAGLEVDEDSGYDGGNFKQFRDRCTHLYSDAMQREPEPNTVGVLVSDDSGPPGAGAAQFVLWFGSEREVLEALALYSAHYFWEEEGVVERTALGRILLSAFDAQRTDWDGALKLSAGLVPFDILWSGSFAELCDSDSGAEIREAFREQRSEDDDSEQEDDEGERDGTAPISADERDFFIEWLRWEG